MLELSEVLELLLEAWKGLRLCAIWASWPDHELVLGDSVLGEWSTQTGLRARGW